MIYRPPQSMREGCYKFQTMPSIRKVGHNMNSLELKQEITSFLLRKKITVLDVVEVKNSGNLMHYDFKKDILFYEPQNIVFDANQHKNNLVEHIQIVTCHEIGHIIDHRNNGEKYESEQKLRDTRLKELDSPYGLSNFEQSLKEINNIFRQSKISQFQKELAAWEIGLIFVPGELVEMYNHLKNVTLMHEQKHLEQAHLNIE